MARDRSHIHQVLSFEQLLNKTGFKTFEKIAQLDQARLLQ
jgi:hypothetical protein